VQPLHRGGREKRSSAPQLVPLPESYTQLTFQLMASLSGLIDTKGSSNFNFHKILSSSVDLEYGSAAAAAAAAADSATPRIHTPNACHDRPCWLL
jgi:hypothetical protein